LKQALKKGEDVDLGNDDTEMKDDEDLD